MKLLFSVISAMFFCLSVNSALAENSCKAFVFYEGASSPEPTQLDCGASTLNMKQCMAACLKVAKKNCPATASTFNANVNFNSPTSGFEVDNKEGRCKK
jgi:hypothetical protein